MHWRRPHFLLRLAVITLLVVNVVPEALAALPLCGSEFGPTRLAMADSAAVAKAALRHSHGTTTAHECTATMPGKQSVAQQAQLVQDDAVAVLPVLAHPVAMLAARGPSPRGSPSRGSAYLAFRSSVLLLI